jgi:hypothetical protein
MQSYPGNLSGCKFDPDELGQILTSGGKEKNR